MRTIAPLVLFVGAIVAISGAIIVLPVLNGLWFGTVDCGVDLAKINYHFVQFVNYSIPAIDGTAETLNQMDAVILRARTLEKEISYQANFAGFEKIPLNPEVGGKKQSLSNVYLQLNTSKSSELDKYKDRWNIGICSIACAMTPGCEGDYQPFSAPPYEEFNNEVEDTVEKYNIFVEAVKKVEGEIDNKIGDVPERHAKANAAYTSLMQEFEEYASALEILHKYQYSSYCSEGLPAGKPPQEKLNSISSIVKDEFISAGETAAIWEKLEQKYPQTQKDWLYNRYTYSKEILDKLGDAESQLDEVEGLYSKYLSFIDCVKKSQIKELVELNAKERIETCNNQPDMGLLREAHVIECYDRAIKALKEGVCPINTTLQLISRSKLMVRVAGAKTEEEFEFFGKTVYGEDLDAPLNNLPEKERTINRTELELEGLTGERGKACLEKLDKMDNELIGVQKEILRLVDDQLSPAAETSFWNFKKKVQTAERIKDWLSARNYNSTVDISSEKETLVKYEKDLVNGNVTAVLLFGRVSKMIKDLSSAGSELNEKLEALHEEVAQVIEPGLEFIGTEKDGSIRAIINEPADMKIYLRFDELPDSTPVTKTLRIRHPLYTGTHNVEIRQNSCKLDTGKDYIPARAVPITGEQKNEFPEAKWNWLIMRKNFRVTALVPSVLMIPLQFEPENIPSPNSPNLKLTMDKNFIYIDINEPGTFLFSIELTTSKPVSPGPSKCEGGFCTIQVNNNLKEPFNLTLFIENQTITSVYDVSTKKEIQTDVADYGVYLNFELPASGTILRLKTNTPPRIPVVDKTKVSLNLTAPKDELDFSELYQKLDSARSMYEAVSKASENRDKLIFVNRELLSYLLSHSWTQLKERRSDAPEVIGTAFSTMENETKRVSLILFNEVMRRNQLIEEATNLKNAADVSVNKEVVEEIDGVYGKPAGYIDYPANVTWLVPEIEQLKNLQQNSDYISSIDKSLSILERMDAEPQPGVERLVSLKGEAAQSIQEAKSDGKLTKVAEDSYNKGEYANSYYQAKNSTIEKELVLPVWLGPAALLGILAICAFAFRERLDEAKISIGKKLEKYRKKAEEDELQKYGL